MGDDFTIKLFTGSYALAPEEAAFREVLTEKARRGQKRKGIRKSDKLDALREEKIKRSRSLEPERKELGEIISGMYQYLLRLQEQLNGKKEWENQP